MNTDERRRDAQAASPASSPTKEDARRFLLLLDLLLEFRRLIIAHTDAE